MGNTQTKHARNRPKNHATIHYSTILALIIGAWSIARAKSEA